MSRKHKKVEPQNAQFKHLRFLNVAAAASNDPLETREAILNNGGFTLAFRIIDLTDTAAHEPLREEYADLGRFAIKYSWAECDTNDNFERKEGRRRSYARLRNMAPNWSDIFVLTDLPEAELKIIERDGEPGEVDLGGLEQLIAKQLIEHFILEQQQYLHTGEDLDSFMDYLTMYQGRLCINSDVLLTGLDDDDLADVSEETVELADQGLDILDSITATLEANIDPATQSLTLNSDQTESLRCELIAMSSVLAGISNLHSEDDELDDGSGNDQDDSDDEDELDGHSNEIGATYRASETETVDDAEATD